MTHFCDMILTELLIEDDNCMLTIEPASNGESSDTASWYDIWEAAVAAWSVCGRDAHGGVTQGVGKSHDPVVVRSHANADRFCRRPCWDRGVIRISCCLVQIANSFTPFKILRDRGWARDV